MTDDDFRYLWSQRHDVLYRVELSAIYHRKRERFFVLLDRGINALGVACGSVAMAQIGGTGVAQWSAGIFTLAATLGLVVGLADLAKRHGALAADFARLEAEIMAAGERDFTETQLAQWSARVREIEVSEPRTLAALVNLCQNDLAIAAGHPDRVVALPWYQRWLAHLVDFPAAKPVTPASA